MSVQLLQELESVEDLWGTLAEKMPRLISEMGHSPSGDQLRLVECYQERLDIVKGLARHITEITDESADLVAEGNVRLAHKVKTLMRVQANSEWDGFYNNFDPIVKPSSERKPMPKAVVWTSVGLHAMGLLTALTAGGLWVKGRINKSKHLKQIKEVKGTLLTHAQAIQQLGGELSTPSLRSYVSLLRSLKTNLELEEAIVGDRSSFRY